MESKQFESLYPEDTREEEVEKLLEIIRSGRSAQVVGIPGSGKSIFLRLLTYNKHLRLKHLGETQKFVHFTLMDFSEMRARPFFDVIKFMLISLSYSLGERGFKELQTEVNNTLKDALSFKDELMLFQALKRSVDYLAVEKKMTLIFLFDRFFEYIPFLDEKFFLNLKILRNHAKYRFSTVFSLPRPLEELLEPSFLSEYYEFIAGNIIYLPFYDPLGLNFRLSYLEKVTHKKISGEIKKELIKLTGGHGKLMRVCFEILLSEKPRDNLCEFLLDKSSVKASLFEIWNALSVQEQEELKKRKETDYLAALGLLKKGGMTIPLLEKFIEKLPKKVYPIIFDPYKNEIRRGDEDFTEKLSPSEFRLLKFLIINHDKTCSKEEIISNVWKDTQTQEGVTDQALDQIIYRVRKKIEADPNNPTRVLTVKGRGYKFSD